MVISGVGVISPIGIGKDAFWNNLVQGVTGIGPLRSVSSGSLPTKLAAEIHDFNPLKYLYEKKFIKVMSRDIQLGVCAASLAERGLTAEDLLIPVTVASPTEIRRQWDNFTTHISF